MMKKRAKFSPEGTGGGGGGRKKKRRSTRLVSKPSLNPVAIKPQKKQKKTRKGIGTNLASTHQGSNGGFFSIR